MNYAANNLQSNCKKFLLQHHLLSTGILGIHNLEGENFKVGNLKRVVAFYAPTFFITTENCLQI